MSDAPEGVERTDWMGTTDERHRAMHSRRIAELEDRIANPREGDEPRSTLETWLRHETDEPRKYGGRTAHRQDP